MRGKAGGRADDPRVCCLFHERQGVKHMITKARENCKQGWPFRFDLQGGRSGKIGAALVLTMLAGLLANAQPAPARALAYFPFTGNAQDAMSNSPPMELVNAPVTNNTLFLNGRYEIGVEGGYRAVAKISGFSYSSFTVALDFNPISLAPPQNNILTGGTLWRWIGFRNNGGLLELTLNNQRSNHVFAGAVLTTNQWQRLVCSFDLQQR
jgi:hypothetical protein